MYSEDTIKKLAKIMEDKQKELGIEIFLIADEPYRELAYDGVEVPYLTKYYNNTIVGYSYSKSLSLPSLQQKVIARCLDAKVNIEAYDKNRKALYEGLTKLGFECIKPEGAFYLFVKSPTEDENIFCDTAKKHNILIVPGSSFGCAGFVRMAYCVSYDTIINSLPHFAEVAKEMGL